MKRDRSFGKKKFSVFNFVLAVLLAVYTVSIFLSIYFIVVNAFKDVADYLGGYNSVSGKSYVGENVFGVPRAGSLTFYNIKEILSCAIHGRRNGISYDFSMIPDIFLYSVVYAVGGAFFAAIVPCITAYFVAKFNYKFSKILYATVIVVIIVPIIGNLPSTYRVLHALNLYDNIFGMFLCKAHFVNMWFLVFYAAFKSVPNDYMEAAYIDGASEFRVMVSIMLPLIRNALFTVVLIFFVDLWNDYQTPALFLPSHRTFAYVVSTFQDMSETKTSDTVWQLKEVPFQMAASAIMTLPTLLLFVAFREKLMGNLTMGGIKG
ncbi:MAG: carbohydrate ABC transporter permease [Clostridia bacterium]|nr:carbohydrate ABC transporter permease [Clostridia bacterium]